MADEPTVDGERIVVKRSDIIQLRMPPDSSILVEARIKAGARNPRLNDIANLVVQDPILALEFLRVTNGMNFSNGGSQIVDIKTAIVRVGEAQLIKTLDEINERPNFEDPDVARSFEVLRGYSRKISIISLIVAKNSKEALSKNARIAGLMTAVGSMAACAALKHKYAELDAELTPKKLAYRLSQDYNIDPDDLRVDYLKNNGFPKDLLLPFDRDMPCKTAKESALRFMVDAAIELVEAFDRGRWDKYAPGNSFPSRSALRLLEVSGFQHKRIYDQCTEYLEVHEDKDDSLVISSEAKEGAASTAAPDAADAKDLDDGPREEYISGDASQMLSKLGQDTLKSLYEVCAEAGSTQQLIEKALATLAGEGPYKRAALLVLGADSNSVKVHAAIGDGLKKGERMSIEDPMSPLKLCTTKIQSYNGERDNQSPFGVSAYAVAPVLAKSSTPVVLYADCGEANSLTFELRRVFRLVVGMLDSTLPNLPGRI